ncbi:MAG TPA: hypothetical protein VJ963_07950 [Bacteroidales bacterium]|nr:hypothetical protein [Bacteroidales bacterium]
MKINIVYSFIALAISGLIAYGFYSFYDGDNRSLLIIACFLLLFISLFMALSVKLKGYSRTTSLLRVISGIMFGIFLITNIIFSLTSLNKDWYIIICGLMLLIYTIIVYSLVRAKQ